MDLTLFLAGCALVGVAAGFLGGLLGIGGGVVIVPALLLLFEARGIDPEVTPALAVGTSLGTIIFTSLSAIRAQWRRGAIRWDVVRRWAPWVVLGSLGSGFVADLLPGVALRGFIGSFLTVVALIMLANWRPAPHRVLPGPLGTAACAGGAGLLSGLAGIGGGNVVVPTLTWFNVVMQQATATASTLGLPIAVAGAVSFLLAGLDASALPSGSLGYLYLPGVLAISVLTVATAPLGVALAHRTPAARLKRVFGVLLLVVAGRLLWGVLS